MTLKVTDINALKKIAEGEVVELPGFSETPFIVRLRQPSLVGLVANGKIPNHLMGIATSLFNNDTKRLEKELESEKGVKGMHEIMTIMAENCLIEPTMEDIRNAGVELTDIQLTAIFNYSQRGAKVLEQFRI